MSYPKRGKVNTQKFLILTTIILLSLLTFLKLGLGYDTKPILITSLCLISSLSYFIPSLILDIKKTRYKPAFLFVQTMPIRLILILSIVLIIQAAKCYNNNNWLIFFIISYFLLLFFEVIYIFKKSRIDEI